MQNFEGKIAVITGGASGMGRELVRQLAAEGCHIAMCDLSVEEMEESRDLALAGAPAGTVITTHICDVSDESSVLAFRDEVVTRHQTDHINLLFNNAGLSGGGSIFTETRESWDRCFAVCWGGVYYGVRAFLPLLTASNEGYIVNTSSVNGFWASIGPDRPHTAYSAAKFAVKGFSEALITDLRVNAPHVKVAVVMPGHIGTSIVSNSRKVQYGTESEAMGREELAQMRERLSASGRDVSQVSDAELQALLAERVRQFRDEAPTTAVAAATVILDGVKAERWRILVGDDAHFLDAEVRKAPEDTYEEAFFTRFAAEAGWKVGR
jgi:NAD(P)-dependent dehydrogenase (short-subunit alcohol dehydrogenase family)